MRVALAHLQALPTSFLLYALSKRLPLRLTSQETFAQLTRLAGPSSGFHALGGNITEQVFCHRQEELSSLRLLGSLLRMLMTCFYVLAVTAVLRGTQN